MSKMRRVSELVDQMLESLFDLYKQDVTSIPVEQCLEGEEADIVSAAWWEFGQEMREFNHYIVVSRELLNLTWYSPKDLCAIYADGYMIYRDKVSSSRRAIYESLKEIGVSHFAK